MKRQSIFIFGITGILCYLILAAAPAQAMKKSPFASKKEEENYLTAHYNRCHYYNNHDWRAASNEFER